MKSAATDLFANYIADFDSPFEIIGEIMQQIFDYSGRETGNRHSADVQSTLQIIFKSRSNYNRSECTIKM